jgi:hypothetical protein
MKDNWSADLNELYLPAGSKNQQILCIACHLILILLHVELLGVWLHPMQSIPSYFLSAYKEGWHPW